MKTYKIGIIYNPKCVALTKAEFSIEACIFAHSTHSIFNWYYYRQTHSPTMHIEIFLYTKQKASLKLYIVTFLKRTGKDICAMFVINVYTEHNRDRYNK